MGSYRAIIPDRCVISWKSWALWFSPITMVLVKCLFIYVTARDVPTFDDILRVYSGFTHGQMATVKQVCMKLQPHELGIDIR